jgi:hypothetical protein
MVTDDNAVRRKKGSEDGGYGFSEVPLRKHNDVDSLRTLIQGKAMVAEEVYNSYIEAVANADVDLYMEAMDMKSLLDGKSKEDQARIQEKADQVIVNLGLDKLWEARRNRERRAKERELRAKERALEKERRAKEEERRAKEEERRAKEEERRAKEEERRAKEEERLAKEQALDKERRAREEIQVLMERIKELESGVK